MNPRTWPVGGGPNRVPRQRVIVIVVVVVVLVVVLVLVLVLLVVVVVVLVLVLVVVLVVVVVLAACCCLLLPGSKSSSAAPLLPLRAPPCIGRGQRIILSWQLCHKLFFPYALPLASAGVGGYFIFRIHAFVSYMLYALIQLSHTHMQHHASMVHGLGWGTVQMAPCIQRRDTINL